jgi:hypothetical protein
VYSWQNYLKIKPIPKTEIMKKSLSNTLIFGILFFISNANAQSKKAPNYAGTWNYEVKNTPYGDYFGKIILVKDKKIYKGQLINKAGIKYRFDLVSMKGKQLVFSSNLEETNSTLNCTFNGDMMTADVKVMGDDFAYKMKAKRTAP